MDAFDGIKTEEQLEKYLRTLASLVPPSKNPYTTFIENTSKSLARQPASARPLLILASAGGAVNCLIFAFIWIVRWRKGVFWVARITRVGKERYFLFHYQNAWSIAASLMLLAFQGYLWGLYRFDSGHLVDDLMFWSTLCWLPGVLAEIIACWTLTTTYALHRRTYSFGKASSSQPFYLSSTFILTAFLAFTLAYIVLSVYFSVFAGMHYSDMFNSLVAAGAILQAAEKSWTGSTDYAVFADVARPLFKMITSNRKLLPSFRGAFLVSGAFAVVIELVFLIVGVAYIHSLRQSLRELEGKSPTGVAAFSRTLRGLILITASMVLYVTLVAANAFWVAILGDKVLTIGTYTQLSSNVPSLTVVAGSSLIALVMLHQTLTSPGVYYTSSAASRRPTTVLPLPSARQSSSAIRHSPSPDLSQHYLQFALASSEPVVDVAVPLPAFSRLDAQPFDNLDNLELQPQVSRLSSEAESITKGWGGGLSRAREPGGDASGIGRGVVVDREEAVAVVRLSGVEYSAGDRKEEVEIGRRW